MIGNNKCQRHKAWRYNQLYQANENEHDQESKKK